MKVLVIHKEIIEKIDESDFNIEIYRCISMLSNLGSELSMPYSKPLGEGLFELRIKNFRIIYCFKNENAYLLNAFTKKRFKIGVKDISLSRKRMYNI